MIHLREITEENFLDAFGLNLAPGQERFVSHPIRSLAQAMYIGNSVSRLASTKTKQWLAT